MAAELTNAPGRRRDQGIPAPLDLAERLRPLLLEMLAPVRHLQDTPLQSDIDCEGIVQAAWRSPSAGALRKELDPRQDWKTVSAVFNALVEQALRDDSTPGEAEVGPAGDERDDEDVPGKGGAATAPAQPHPTAAWLEHYATVMRGVHATAAEMVGLRLEGYMAREIAERLGLGLRLVGRILRDARRGWEKETKE